MRLLISWLRDFVDVKASPHEIAGTLGLRGFEVAAVEPLENGDGVVDFEVTANRPDCLSVLGFAREIATAYDLPLRLPSDEADSPIALTRVTTGRSDRLTVSLEDVELCPRYSAAVADIAPTRSRGWMTTRLQAAGVRPINALVDVTNYVLIELGHPMHAFDLERLAGDQLRIRRAAASETITTLDGVERRLDAEMLVIADAFRAQAVAGVMGGVRSEVTETTRAAVLESACFKPASVRRTSKRLGVRTEASARFERGADVNAPVMAIRRAAALMQQIGAGHLVGPVIDCYPSVLGPRALLLRRSRLALVLGLEVPDADVTRILRSLGLEVNARGDSWDVVAPTFRVDLLREIDLVEEVGRHYGFDKLQSAFPAASSPALPPDLTTKRDQLARGVLVASGLQEAITFGFVEAKAAQPFAGDPSDTLVPIANPLSGKFDTLRPSLLPGLVDAVAHNRRHGRRDVALFELGARFTAHDGERRGVAVAWTGLAAEHWSGGTREVDFFDVKGIVERLCAAFGAEATVAATSVRFLVDGQSAAVAVAGCEVGVVGLLDAAIAESRGAPRHDGIFVAELDLERVASRGREAAKRAQALPRYPFVVRDLSIVIPDTLPAETIRGTIQAAGRAGRAPLAAVVFFDRYKGKGLAETAVSLSVRLTFQAEDRTLTDAEVQESFDAIMGALAREHGALQR